MPLPGSSYRQQSSLVEVVFLGRKKAEGSWRHQVWEHQG